MTEQEQIEVWRKEFHKIAAARHSLTYNIKTGVYLDNSCQQYWEIFLMAKRTMPVIFATQEVINAVHALNNNVRSERGVIASGIRDNDETRSALAVIIGHKFEAPSIEIPAYDMHHCAPVRNIMAKMDAAGYQYKIKGE